MKRSQRFSYAAAFGTLAQLCASMVFDAKHAFTYDGPAYLKGFYYFFLSISLFWTFMLLEQMFIYFFLRKLKKNFIHFAYQSLIKYLLSVKLVNSAFWHYSLILFWLLITVFIALVSMLIYGMCYLVCRNYRRKPNGILHSNLILLGFYDWIFSDLFCTQEMVVSTLIISMRFIICEKTYTDKTLNLKWCWTAFGYHILFSLASTQFPDRTAISRCNFFIISLASKIIEIYTQFI